MSLFDRIAELDEAQGQQSRAGRFQNTPGDAYQHTDWRMKGVRNKASGSDFAGRNKRYPNPSKASPKNWARAAGALRALDIHNPPDKKAIAKKIKARYGLKCVKAAGDAGCHKGDPGGGPEGGKKFKGETGSKKGDKKLKKVAKSKKADHPGGKFKHWKSGKNVPMPWPYTHTGERKYDPGWSKLSGEHKKRAAKRGERGAAKGAAKDTAQAAKKPKKGQKKLAKAAAKAAKATAGLAKEKHKVSKKATQWAKPGAKKKAAEKVEKAQAGIQKAIAKGKPKKAAKAVKQGAKKLGKAAKKAAKVNQIGKRRKRARKATGQAGF